MQHIETATREVKVIASVTCDRCGKTEEPSFGGFEGWHFFRDTGGYGSVFGDGTVWTLDLCESCFKALVGEWVCYPEPEEIPCSNDASTSTT